MSECKVIAISNQKGGVAKTTTALNLGAYLNMKGKKVLLIDFDPQGSLTTSLGFRNQDEMETTIKTMLEKTIRKIPFEKTDGIVQNSEGIKLIPSNMELGAFEKGIASLINREKILSEYIKQIRDDYDYIIIDCQPSVEILTINALTAADSVIIPVQTHYLSLKGMTQLLDTIDKIRVVLNPKLKIDGILLTLANMQTKLARSTVDTLRNNYGSVLRVYKTIIPLGIKVAECSIEGKSIFAYDKNCKVAMAYENFSREVLRDSERIKNGRTAECR